MESEWELKRKNTTEKKKLNYIYVSFSRKLFWHCLQTTSMWTSTTIKQRSIAPLDMCEFLRGVYDLRYVRQFAAAECVQTFMWIDLPRARCTQITAGSLHSFTTTKQREPWELCARQSTARRRRSEEKKNCRGNVPHKVFNAKSK